ncbi:hypothetical protein BrL25_05390 [Brevibacillus laterosporus DSM 25]|nr:hypothetical protein BrL25_05390 [Brevibacillus laterosporus DSM 25]
MMDRFKAPDHKDEPLPIGKTCPYCEEDIVEGDNIDVLHGGEITHTDCTSDYLRDQHVDEGNLIAERDVIAIGYIDCTFV